MPEECEHGCCHNPESFDWFFWASLSVVVLLYCADFIPARSALFGDLTFAVREITNTVLPGIALGVISIAFISLVPREAVASVLGGGHSAGGIARAVFAGVFFDVCNHGVVLLGVKLYERGASMGQVAAFLLASPWNSLSLTFVLIALAGVWWTLVFIALSVVVAFITGLVFIRLEKNAVVPPNPNAVQPAEGGLGAVFESLRAVRLNRNTAAFLTASAFRDSKPVLRWLLFGVILAALIRTFGSHIGYEDLFGPTLAGLGLTVIAATVIEVCSEGSTPIAADLLNRAGAPGNAFTFLMAGAATDYTEIMAVKETTRSWKLSLFIPLIAVPQIVLLSAILNGWFAG
ncbi:MAG: ATPase [Candidatus Mycalebacterium zealandia]|nr:MAG: ATPase [Candidatus Mycalebacterium zealandia]